jgi:hypothetical protein
MKARSLVVSGLLAGVMLLPTSVAVSANFAWCMSDPPVLVTSPGGNNLMVNNQVYLPAGSLSLMDEVFDSATARPDGHGGTLLTVQVFVPAPSRVVSSVYRYRVSAQGYGSGVVTLFLDVPVT